MSEWRCPGCGFMKDTPQHELGCPLGRAEAVADQKKQDVLVGESLATRGNFGPAPCPVCGGLSAPAP